MIRYADVLLMKAEALIELHRAEEARTLINKVRNRAKNSTIFVFYALDKINISLYKAEGWNESSARKALRWERRLELAMENGRFFDLVRWGIAEEVMNEYYSDEQSRRNYYEGAHFSANKHEYLAIPEQQIKFSKYLYKQNVGY